MNTNFTRMSCLFSYTIQLLYIIPSGSFWLCTSVQEKEGSFKENGRCLADGLTLTCVCFTDKSFVCLGLVRSHNTTVYNSMFV